MHFKNSIFRLHGYILKTLKIKCSSETSKYRRHLLKFCKGDGIDIGYGGDPIKSSAITIDNTKEEMAYCGDSPLNLNGNAKKLHWFADDVLDYVYSSHCLEDFENTKEILIEWLRVIKPGGVMILLLPDQKRYENYCKINKKRPNPAHKIRNFGIQYIKNIIREIGNASIIYEKDMEDDYSFEMVIEKL